MSKWRCSDLQAIFLQLPVIFHLIVIYYLYRSQPEKFCLVKTYFVTTINRYVSVSPLNCTNNTLKCKDGGRKMKKQKYSKQNNEQISHGEIALRYLYGAEPTISWNDSMLPCHWFKRRKILHKPTNPKNITSAIVHKSNTCTELLSF